MGLERIKQVEGNDKFWKNAAYLLLAILVIMGVALGIRNFYSKTVIQGIIGLGAAAFLLVPVLVRFLGLEHPYKYYCFLFGFSIVAYDVGCAWQGFERYAFLDKFTHFVSGPLFTILGFFLFFLLNRSKLIDDKWLVAATYAFFFSLAVAVVWEIIEFADFNLTGHDGQNHLTTGVYDTMYDLIACFAGSLLSIGSYILYIKKEFALITGPVLEEFLKKNRKKWL